jgi:hypothetical protein
LNGGGLIAIPATVALFKVDPRQAQIQVLCAAGFFIAGLIAALIVQVLAFMAMERRAEWHDMVEERLTRLRMET